MENARFLGEGIKFDLMMPTSSIRYKFLDGIRGLASLWVVFFHVGAVYSKEYPGMELFNNWLVSILRHGYIGVPIFILLSGYCLMLPVARSRDGMLRGGIKDYIRRRALRILPAYYAAVVFGIVSTYLAQVAKSRMGMSGNGAALQDVTRFDVLFSHLFLVHNLFENLNQTLNPAMWSVAVEWQIYFVFALMLLPLWRRFGMNSSLFMSLATILVTSVVIGYAPLFLLPQSYNLVWCKPWFVGVFGLGMVGAIVCNGQNTMGLRLLNRIPWGIVAVVSLVLLVIYKQLGLSWYGVEDWIVAVMTLGVILGCVRAMEQSSSNPGLTGDIYKGIAKFLESPVLAFLGAISYSLYLTHFFVLFRVGAFLSSRHVSTTVWSAVMFIVGIGCAIGLAWIFYLLFEKPFMNFRTKSDSSVVTLLKPQPSQAS